MIGDPIYFMEAEVAFKKKKTVYSRHAWIVSQHTSPTDIMSKDTKTMSRLGDEFYGNSKGERNIIIRKIKSKKQIGTVSWEIK